jgi:hypothetical protein
VFEKWRCATGKKRECRLRKCDVRGHLRPTFEAGAPGVAEGEKRRRWEASESVIVERGGWVFLRCAVRPFFPLRSWYKASAQVELCQIFLCDVHWKSVRSIAGVELWSAVCCVG